MNLSQEDRELERQLKEAWRLFVTGGWLDALHLLQSVLLIDPDNAMANSLAGACLLRLGHFEEAEEYARSGVRLAPNIALAHTFLAEALCASEQYAEAEGEYWEAVAVNPDSPDPLIALGALQLSQDRRLDARSAIERAIEKGPEDADAHYLMAVCYARDTATDEAVKEIDLAIKFAPNSSTAWYYRGLILTSRAKGLKNQRERLAVFREVSESLRKAVEFDADNAEARMHLKAVSNAIAAIEQHLDSVGELKGNWWQIALAVAGLVIFAILDRSFWTNAMIVVAALTALALWRSRRRIVGLGPDPIESIHPLQLTDAISGFRATADAKLVNEWSN